MTGLRAESVSLQLGGACILDRVEAVFAPGRVTAVLGPNGAGKSTLLACLAGLRAPDAGCVSLDGTPVLDLDRRNRARRIGLLPQASEVAWDIDVRTLVGLGRFPHRARWGDTDADRTAIDDAMRATDTAAVAARGVASLSGGERARVLLARVLAGQPDWLLADEPLAHLDPAHALDVLDRLRDVARGGAGVIVVLHDLGHAARVADDVVLLRAGRVAAAGPTGDVLTPARIAATYGIAAAVELRADGLRSIVPLYRI